MTRKSHHALILGIAKFWFLIMGLAQTIVLPIVIKQAEFGSFKRALAFVNIFNNVIVIASIQAVSRTIASTKPSHHASVFQKAIKLHAWIGICIGTLFFSLIPWIVSYQKAPQLKLPLQVLSGIIVLYSLYSPLIGFLNGTHRLRQQGQLDILFSTLRTLLMIVVGYAFAQTIQRGALGASSGFLIAAILILPITWLFVKPLASSTIQHTFSNKHYLYFFTGLICTHIFQSIVLQIDLILLGREATLRYKHLGPLAEHAANQFSGLYAQAQAFGLLPYQLMIASWYILFPKIAEASSSHDHKKVHSIIAQGGNFALLFLGLIVVCIGSAPESMMRFIFGNGQVDGYASIIGAPILRILTLAHGCTAMASIGIMIVAATGHARTSTWLAGIFCMLISSSALLMSKAAAYSGIQLGVFIALGVAIGAGVGLCIVSAVIHKKHGPLLPLRSLIRTIAAIGIAFTLGNSIPTPTTRIFCGLIPLIPLVVYLCTLALFDRLQQKPILGEYVFLIRLLLGKPNM